ncbi:protein of unknown function [Cardinium endosymbiont cEper1 of Encarsia pergandiella]|nr:protein of unknown function [Cardinium endosymbiont cEper1 of Encarsia pergandiella]
MVFIFSYHYSCQSTKKEAVIHNNIESARELIAKKAKKEIMDRSGNSAFSYASAAYNIEIMKLLSSS